MTDTAVPAGGFGWASEWRHRFFGALADNLANEGGRRLLWLPVFFGAGIGVYFLLKVEPPLWAAGAAAAASAGAVFALRERPGWREAALVLAMFCAGFALMRETAWQREAAMVQRRLGPVAVSGRVVDIDLVERGTSRRAATSSIRETGSTSRRRSIRFRHSCCPAAATCSGSSTLPGSTGSATPSAPPIGSPLQRLRAAGVSICGSSGPRCRGVSPPSSPARPAEWLPR